MSYIVATCFQSFVDVNNSAWDVSHWIVAFLMQSEPLYMPTAVYDISKTFLFCSKILTDFLIPNIKSKDLFISEVYKIGIPLPCLPLISNRTKFLIILIWL